MSDPVAASGSGTRLTLHIQPRSSVTEVVGLHGDAVKIRIAAPPVDGAANDEITGFVARLVRVPRRAVRLVSGGGGRRKQLVIDGVPPATVRRALGLPP
ncbi:MAG: DUF167 domain-containing protein [Gemmatimonadales bacterium]